MLSIKFLRITLWYISIGAGIIATVLLQEIDNTPHAQASAQSNTNICKEEHVDEWVHLTGVIITDAVLASVDQESVWSW